MRTVPPFFWLHSITGRDIRYENEEEGGEAKAEVQETTLANINQAKQLLDKARTLDSVIEVRNKAAAIEAYARAKGAEATQRIAWDLMIQAEWKAGGFLLDIPREPGARTNLTLSHDVTRLSDVRQEYGRGNVDRC